jgi:hypothetical protein
MYLYSWKEDGLLKYLPKITTLKVLLKSSKAPNPGPWRAHQDSCYPEKDASLTASLPSASTLGERLNCEILLKPEELQKENCNLKVNIMRLTQDFQSLNSS